MEKIDLYDENKIKTSKTILKGEPVPSGRYYITVVVWIENSKGEFLIQQRVPKKDNKWATTGGHPIAGESSLEGIVSEINEELGLIVNPNKLVLFKTEKTEDDFIDFYHLKENYNIQDIVIQEEEVQAVKWVSIDEIKRLIENNEFSNSHAIFFN